IIRDETQIEMGMKNLEGAQSIDLERNRGEMLAQIGELEKQNETPEFKEALELYFKPRGTWNVPIIKDLGDKKVMNFEKIEGDVEKVVDYFLTSKDKLTPHDKEILEDKATEFLIKQENKSLIEKVNSFFEPVNQLTLENINVLNVAVDQFLTLKDKNAVKILEKGLNEFLGSPKESVLKNVVSNSSESLFKNKLYSVLVHITTKEDVEVLKEALKGKKDLKKTVDEYLTLKAKEVLETAVNKLLTLKRKKVLLILGSGCTGKSTFNRYLARRLWQSVKQDMTQPIPLFIALAPLEEFINKNQDFIEVYLREKGKLTTDQIKELRNRKFVFILDGYDEIAEHERHCYHSNMFSKWKNAKIIISCRPEYLDVGYEKRFWPEENEERGFQEITLTPFSWNEIKQYIIRYVDYSKKNSRPLPLNADTYIQQIKNIPQIEDLVCNPILLKITLTVLPDLLGKIKTSQISRIVLYDEFVMKWFERAQDRLLKIQLKPKELKEFNRLNVDFTEHCLQFGKEFAFKMFMDNNKVVVNYDPINEKITSNWTRLLGKTDEKIRLIRFSMPLIRRGN
ncbi:35547_t:CDS:1, partial [Racocetra persica]